MINSNTIEYKLEEISSVLLSHQWQSVSLTGGLGSELLFWYYYLRFKSNDEINRKFFKSLNDSLKLIQDRQLGVSFSYGLTGIYWAINHIKDYHAIQDSDILKVDDSFYESLIKEAEAEIDKDNFDLLSGAIGTLMSIIDYNNANKFNTSVFKMFQKQINGKWQSKEDKDRNEYNFGLAHGMPSVISFLSIYSNAISSNRCYNTINDCLEFILSTKKTDSKGSLFPSILKCNGSTPIYNSRLGWCYGDLGIANAFWQAGKAFKNKNWQTEAVSILLHTSKRRNLIDNLVLDCGLCHGTSGIAHIFNRFYKETGVNEFDDVRWFWLNKTIELADFEDGLAGYKNFLGDEGYQNDYGLLEGISGIGLVLMGFLKDDTRIMNWDRCLLLS